MNFKEGCCWCQKIINRRVYVDGVGLFLPELYKKYRFRVRRDIYFCSQCAVITFPQRDAIVKEIHDYIDSINTLLDDFGKICQYQERGSHTEQFTQYLFYDANFKFLANYYRKSLEWPDLVNRAEELKMRAIFLVSRKYINFY